MDDPYRNGVQTFAETGTEVGESCAVGACGTATGVPFCAGEPVQSDAEAADIVGLLYGNMIGNSAGNAFRADTLQSGTNFSNNISQTALDGSMGAAGSGMGGVFGITGSGMGAFGTGVWRIPERLLSIFTILWLAGVILFTGYAVYSYVRVRRQVAEAMWLRENLWICDAGKISFYPGTA